MTARRWWVCGATLALLTSWTTGTAVAQAPSVTPDLLPGASPPDSASAAVSVTKPIVWLRGPFGRVAGGTRGEPAATPPEGTPLDMLNRRMPLLLELEDPDLLPATRVTTEPMGSGESETLAQGQSAFEGPAAPGRQLVVARIESPAGAVDRVWLVDVPDRDPPPDGLLDIPAPRIIVSTEAGRQVAETADGCYAFLCVETGLSAPASALEPLTAVLRETPRLSIEDGSALVAWQGRLTRLDGGHHETREASGAITDTPVAAVSLTGLEPSAPGEWLLEVRVEFDRERGWTWIASRLVVG